MSDLIRGPKRFTDLQRGQPIPSNVLSARLKELEDAGVVRRRALPRPAGGVGYELTEYGRELEDVVLRLGLWGAKSMPEPRPDDVVTADTLLLSLRSTFQPEAGRELGPATSFGSARSSSTHGSTTALSRSMRARWRTRTSGSRLA